MADKTKNLNTEESEELNVLFQKLKDRENSQNDEYKKTLAEDISSTFVNLKSRDRSMNQSDFAKILGCSQSRVSNIVNGDVAQFTVDKLLGFCTRLGMNPLLQTKPIKALKSEGREIIDILNKKVS